MGNVRIDEVDIGVEMHRFFSKSSNLPMGKMDGWDGEAIYQMVPEGGSRGGLTLTSRNEAIEAVIEPAGIVRFAPPNAAYKITLDPHKTVTFQLTAEKVGRAEVSVSNARQERLETLSVSVKSPVKKTYSLNVVSDMFHRSPWVHRSAKSSSSGPAEPPTSLRPMMDKVEGFFRHQAFVLLRDVAGQVFECKVGNRDLGNPIHLQDLIRPGNKQVLDLITDEVNPSASMADIRIFFTWNIVGDEDALGFTTRGGKSVFVAFDANELKKGLTTAHELGHALGLFHGKRTDTLMAEKDTNLFPLLEKSEIDLINPSGT